MTKKFKIPPLLEEHHLVEAGDNTATFAPPSSTKDELVFLSMFPKAFSLVMGSVLEAIQDKRGDDKPPEVRRLTVVMAVYTELLKTFMDNAESNADVILSKGALDHALMRVSKSLRLADETGHEFLGKEQDAVPPNETKH